MRSPLPASSLQGISKTLPVRGLSGTSPLADDAAFAATGSAELAAAAEAAAPGLDLQRAAAALWRKTVALAWAADFPHLMASEGIG